MYGPLKVESTPKPRKRWNFIEGFFLNALQRVIFLQKQSQRFGKWLKFSCFFILFSKNFLTSDEYCSLIFNVNYVKVNPFLLDSLRFLWYSKVKQPKSLKRFSQFKRFFLEILCQIIVSFWDYIRVSFKIKILLRTFQKLAKFCFKKKISHVHPHYSQLYLISPQISREKWKFHKKICFS